MAGLTALADPNCKTHQTINLPAEIGPEIFNSYPPRPRSERWAIDEVNGSRSGIVVGD